MSGFPYPFLRRGSLQGCLLSDRKCVASSLVLENFHSFKTFYVAYFGSGRVFTCSHCSTQRGESINSLIKENGQKNKELRKYNLFQLSTYLSNKVARIEESSLNEICSMIEQGRQWSRYVDEQWNQQLKKSHQLPFVEETATGRWVASTAGDFPQTHQITLEDSLKFGIPTCSCRPFTASAIPCTGICAVFSWMTRELFEVRNLHPRWIICNHPLYIIALQKKKLAVPELPQIKPHDEPRHQLTPQAYNHIICPSKSDLRNVKLNQQFKKIEPTACRVPHIYKLLMMNLIAFEQSLTNSEPSGFILDLDTVAPCNRTATETIQIGTQSIPILPPTTKKRKRADGLLNKSALKRNRGRCKQCVANGVVPSDNHRSYSKRCPFSNNQ